MSSRSDIAVAGRKTLNSTSERRRLAQLEALLRKAYDDCRALQVQLDEARSQVRQLEAERLDRLQLADRLAASNAEAAELMAELEERNSSLRSSNLELARANANAAELMAIVEIREDENQRLTRSLSSANARAAELVAEREIELEEKERLNKKLVREISERRKAERENAALALQLKTANEELDRLATLDSLTDLLNRRGLTRELDAELHRAARTGTQIGVLFADFDDFKSMNERFGHSGGDVALKEVGRRMKASLRSTDHLARIGGDEFLALLPAVERETLELVARRLHTSACGQAVRIRDEEVTVTISAAAALLPADVTSIDAILGLTRNAQKHSKESGKNRITFVE